MRRRLLTVGLALSLVVIPLGKGHSFVLFAARPAQGAQAGLKIAVIEGEDAINVIQQKTAVAPVVEVRDRNNQPVAGAVVRFAITKGRATFSGARALTMTTNAAGRAMAAGFTPTGTGALQISASAAFQGQTAVAAIVQTNVLTAAQAASVAAASSGVGGTGASAGAGGGLSATTVGVVAGAAAGGAVAVKTLTDPPGTGGTLYVGPYTGPILFTATSNGTPRCTFTINVAGTLTMHLTTNDAAGVSGTVDLHENDTLGQSTCTGASAGPIALDKLQVNGSTVTVTFQKQQTFASTGATLTATFQGGLSGDTITGTLNETWNTPAPTGLTTAEASFPVVLQKQ